MRRIVCLALMALLLLTGCTKSVIQEDAVKDALPGLYPDAGVAKDQEVTLYFRLAGEPLLVPVKRMVSVRSSEYAERAVMRALIEGPSALSQELTGVIPEGVRLVDTASDGNILYVTLSRELIDPPKNPVDREELALTRRMAVYAIVNSLCELSGYSRVQLRVDMTNTGQGTRVTPSMVGFAEDSAQWLDTMSKEESVIANPKNIAELILQHLAAGELTDAYQLFAEMEQGERQKPDYAAFETEMLTLGHVEEFQINGYEISEDGRTATVRANIAWRPRGGNETTRGNVVLNFELEGSLYKMGFDSFVGALRGEGALGS